MKKHVFLDSELKANDIEKLAFTLFLHMNDLIKIKPHNYFISN